MSHLVEDLLIGEQSSQRGSVRLAVNCYEAALISA